MVNGHACAVCYNLRSTNDRCLIDGLSKFGEMLRL